MHQSDRSWLVEMLITLEPHNIFGSFGSNFAYVYILTLSSHCMACKRATCQFGQLMSFNENAHNS